MGWKSDGDGLASQCQDEDEVWFESRDMNRPHARIKGVFAVLVHDHRSAVRQLCRLDIQSEASLRCHSEGCHACFWIFATVKFQLVQVSLDRSIARSCIRHGRAIIDTVYTVH